MPAMLVPKNQVQSWRSLAASALGFSHSGVRDLYQSFGYPQIIHVHEYFGMYERNDIANRIIGAFPRGTWRDEPTIRDDAGTSPDPSDAEYSPFVEAVHDLFKKHKIAHYLERADRLASIGHYGILLLGFSGIDEFDQPLSSGPNSLMYLAPYGEPAITVNKWCTDQHDPRYGKPELYNIAYKAVGAAPAMPMKAMRVHHSRVLHIAEQLDQDEVFGMPRLKPVFNRLKDLEKVVGGAAEMFWLTADRGMLLSVDKDMDISEDQKLAIEKQIENYQNKTQRYFIAKGIDAKPLGTEQIDPMPNATVLLDLIAGTVGIPKRILLGTERGELASSQDENNWAQRIGERRNTWAAPMVLLPLIKRLVDAGALPQPEGNIVCEWAKSDTMNESEKADVAVKKATAISTYASGFNSETVVPIAEFREQVLGLDPISEYDVAVDLTDIPDPAATAGNPANDIQPAVGDRPIDKANAAEKKTLYVSRAVKNVSSIKAWAKSQGFKNVQDDLHVTITYSILKVDWSEVGDAWTGCAPSDENLTIGSSQARAMERFGDAIVLKFSNDDLHARHNQIIWAGAAHGFAEYQPHVTISYKEPGLDLSKVVPYAGAIVLGPEAFAEIDEDAT